MVKPGGAQPPVRLTQGQKANRKRMAPVAAVFPRCYGFHAEESLEAELWVPDRNLRILFGDVSQVVKGIRQCVTQRGLFGAKRKTQCGVADYLHRHRARMRYDESLAQGWPIASGPLERACKNLIKDRMERSGTSS